MLNKSWPRFQNIFITFLASILVSFFMGSDSPVYSEEITNSLTNAEVPESRRTQFGLYLTARESYMALTRNPSIVFIDVRDPIEVISMGHPEPMDVNIPVFFVSRELDPVERTYKLVLNENFVAEVDQFMNGSGFNKSHPIIVICREGARATYASELLYNAGYSTVWNQIDGFANVTPTQTGEQSREDSWIGAGLPIRFKLKEGAEWKQLRN